MGLHNIQEDDLPYKIRMNLEKYKKSLNNNSNNNTEEEKSGNKSISTSRKPVKHKIDTDINHVAVTGGDMITLRNKDKKVNIKKGLENSILDNLSNKSKSNTRNKEKENNSKKDLGCSNGDSLKALDDLMSVQNKNKSKNTNGNFVLKKNKITFKPIRGRLRNKQKPNIPVASKEVSTDYKSVPQKLTETTEQNLGNGRLVQQSRNKAKE